jgi:hypothetical protein
MLERPIGEKAKVYGGITASSLCVATLAATKHHENLREPAGTRRYAHLKHPVKRHKKMRIPAAGDPSSCPIHAAEPIAANKADIKEKAGSIFACSGAPEVTEPVGIAAAASSLAAPLPTRFAVVIGFGTVIASGTPVGPTSISWIRSVVELKLVWASEIWLLARS